MDKKEWEESGWEKVMEWKESGREVLVLVCWSRNWWKKSGWEKWLKGKWMIIIKVWLFSGLPEIFAFSYCAGLQNMNQYDVLCNSKVENGRKMEEKWIKGIKGKWMGKIDGRKGKWMRSVSVLINNWWKKNGWKEINGKWMRKMNERKVDDHHHNQWPARNFCF